MGSRRGSQDDPNCEYTNNGLTQQVLGVDISAVMVDTAKASSSSDKVRFLVGDCSKAVQFPGGPYDLAFGAWLLNYASSHAEMVNMFRNAAANLREGGFFVGVTPHPTDDPEKHIEAALKARPEQYGGITVQATGKVEDGIAAKVTAMVEPQKIEFDAFYLKKSVYESAAREGGFHGPLTWNMVKLPEEQKSRGHEWDTYMTVPHFCVLVIVKI